MSSPVGGGGVQAAGAALDSCTIFRFRPPSPPPRWAAAADTYCVDRHSTHARLQAGWQHAKPLCAALHHAPPLCVAC